MRKQSVNCKDCSYLKLKNLSEKAGFQILQGKKHAKVKTIEGKPITIIPRHTKVKRETARGILKRLKKYGANLDII